MCIRPPTVTATTRGDEMQRRLRVRRGCVWVQVSGVGRHLPVLLQPTLLGLQAPRSVHVQAASDARAPEHTATRRCHPGFEWRDDRDVRRARGQQPRPRGVSGLPDQLPGAAWLKRPAGLRRPFRLCPCLLPLPRHLRHSLRGCGETVHRRLPVLRAHRARASGMQNTARRSRGAARSRREGGPRRALSRHGRRALAAPVGHWDTPMRGKPILPCLLST